VVLVVESELGWAMIVIGVLLVIIEVTQPGFFIAVPGTVLIVLGAMVLFLPQYLGEWTSVVMVVTALISSILTIILYRRVATPAQKPSSTSRDTLIGKTGVVTHTVQPHTLRGKVKIENQEWSATSDTRIEEGRRIEVINSEGVHVIVRELK
jgi:membrane protein implicated in regulation of membrane protease activity